MFAHPYIAKGSVHSTQNCGQLTTVPSTVSNVYVTDMIEIVYPVVIAATSALTSIHNGFVGSNVKGYQLEYR